MGTHYSGTPAEVQALDTYVKLVRATNSLTTRVHHHLAGAGLSLSQFGVLEALLHLGSLMQRQLSEKLLKSGGNITMVVDNLEKRGLVRRDRQGDDRRCVKVCLTEPGHQLISQIFPAHVTAVVEEMSILNESEQSELGRLCRRLGKKE